MMKIIYSWVHDCFSAPSERGEYSAGYLQNKVREKAIALCQNQEGKLLEVGCGEGLFLRKLSEIKASLDVYGMDNSKERIKQARVRLKKNPGIKLYTAEAVALPFPDADFDVVVCVNVIFNLQSKEMTQKVFREINRVCKKGGRIIFDFRNKSNLLLKIKYKLAPLYDPTVKNLPLMTYSKKEIGALLCDSGFKLLNAFPIGLGAPVIVVEAEKT